MIRKFFLVILATYLQSACTLSATDIYPKNLPDLFWEFRTHFYSRLSNPAATKEDFQNTICEFVRVCDYIPADFVVKDKLREDFNKHGLSSGLSADVLVGVLSALDELEAREAITLGDSSSIRSLTGNGAVATTSHLQEAFDLYPHNISSFFWVARNHFYVNVAQDGCTVSELRNLLCEFISVGDHVASSPFMRESLRSDFNEFAFGRGVKRKRKVETLKVLSELEAIGVYTVRPIPGYNPIQADEIIARYEEEVRRIAKYIIDQRELKQRAQIAEAKTFLGAAFSGLLTPEQIATRLKVNIRGQDAAMNTLGLIGHKIMAQIRLKQEDASWRFRPPHAFLVGKSGSGKTQSIIELCKIIGIPWIRVNAPEVVGEGFKGPTLSYYYDQLKQAGKIPPYAVVLLDEAGKMGKTGSGDDAPKYGGSIMRTLLAHMDGANVKLSSGPDGREESMSTNCFTYIATDACAHVPDSVSLTAESLSAYTGMPLELINRFSQGIIKLVPHTVSSLVNILKNSTEGVYNHERNFFKKLHNIDLIIDDAGLRAIAKRSLEDSTGARKLEELLGHVLAPLYSLPEELITEVDGARTITLTEQFVKDHLPPPVKKIKDEPPFGMYT